MAMAMAMGDGDGSGSGSGSGGGGGGGSSGGGTKFYNGRHEMWGFKRLAGEYKSRIAFDEEKSRDSSGVATLKACYLWVTYHPRESSPSVVEQPSPSECSSGRKEGTTNSNAGVFGMGMPHLALCPTSGQMKKVA
uniref:Uncharacterized protein n=1 Tax=Vespula pensylvanica TaxID=30213 RepID=A0A834U8E2_VESPE|nr:hypothetical protein H0235_009351 [Vespula pensylvanica]